MASAVKNTSAIGAFFGLSFWLASAASAQEALAAPPLAQPNVCPLADLASLDKPGLAVPQHLRGNALRIYRVLDDMVFQLKQGTSEYALSDGNAVLQQFLTPEYHADAETLNGIKAYEWPKYERFLSQRRSFEDNWNALSVFEQWRALADTLMGIDALRGMIGVELMEDSGLEERLDAESSEILDFIGITEPEDYSIVERIAAQCQKPPLDAIPQPGHQQPLPALKALIG